MEYEQKNYNKKLGQKIKAFQFAAGGSLPLHFIPLYP